MIKSITDKTFEKEVLLSEVPVIVDFWANWCAPCKMITPILEELEKEYKKKIKIVKLNVDSNNKTTSKYNIISIPSLIFFKKGEVVAFYSGALPKSVLKEIIQDKFFKGKK